MSLAIWSKIAHFLDDHWKNIPTMFAFKLFNGFTKEDLKEIKVLCTTMWLCDFVLQF